MLEGMNIYWIGGSSCCGKSTISERLVKEFGFEMYKCDNHLERYIEIGVENDIAIMKKFKAMSVVETWSRDICEQVEEEFEFYREALKIIVEDLEEVFMGKSVVVEGSAILPEFIKNNKISSSKYVCMVPTKEFQIDKYSKREWIQHYLESCSNPEKAFENWMERDARYAEIVKEDAYKNNMNVVVVDGNKTIDDNYRMIKQFFGLV